MFKKKRQVLKFTLYKMNLPDENCLFVNKVLNNEFLQQRNSFKNSFCSHQKPRIQLVDIRCDYIWHETNISSNKVELS